MVLRLALVPLRAQGYVLLLCSVMLSFKRSVKIIRVRVRPAYFMVSLVSGWRLLDKREALRTHVLLDLWTLTKLVSFWARPKNLSKEQFFRSERQNETLAPELWRAWDQFPHGCRSDAPLGSRGSPETPVSSFRARMNDVIDYQTIQKPTGSQASPSIYYETQPATAALHIVNIITQNLRKSNARSPNWTLEKLHDY